MYHALRFLGQYIHIFIAGLQIGASYLKMPRESKNRGQKISFFPENNTYAKNHDRYHTFFLLRYFSLRQFFFSTAFSQNTLHSGQTLSTNQIAPWRRNEPIRTFTFVACGRHLPRHCIHSVHQTLGMILRYVKGMASVEQGHLSRKPRFFQAIFPHFRRPNNVGAITSQSSVTPGKITIQLHRLHKFLLMNLFTGGLTNYLRTHQNMNLCSRVNSVIVARE